MMKYKERLEKLEHLVNNIQLQLKTIHKFKFEIGDYVYLKNDPESKNEERIIVDREYRNAGIFNTYGNYYQVFSFPNKALVWLREHLIEAKND